MWKKQNLARKNLINLVRTSVALRKKIVKTKQFSINVAKSITSAVLNKKIAKTKIWRETFFISNYTQRRIRARLTSYFTKKVSRQIYFCKEMITSAVRLLHTKLVLKFLEIEFLRKFSPVQTWRMLFGL